jgi:hypothetical protein
MVDEYQKLVDANEKLKEYKEVASSKQLAAELQEWLNNGALKSESGQDNLFTTILGLNEDDVTRLLLPETGMVAGKGGSELTSS